MIKHLTTRSLDPWGFNSWITDDLFNSFRPRKSEIAVDISEYEGNYAVRAEIVGVPKEDISVEVDNNLLTISAEKRRSDENSTYSEISYGKFSKSIRLGDDIAKGKISARHKDGVLIVTLPKKKESTTKNIEIK